MLIIFTSVSEWLCASGGFLLSALLPFFLFYARALIIPYTPVQTTYIFINLQFFVIFVVELAITQHFRLHIVDHLIRQPHEILVVLPVAGLPVLEEEVLLALQFFGELLVLRFVQVVDEVVQIRLPHFPALVVVQDLYLFIHEGVNCGAVKLNFRFQVRGFERERSVLQGDLLFLSEFGFLSSDSLFAWFGVSELLFWEGRT